MKRKTLSRKELVSYLLCIYIGAVLLRFLLALVTTSFPTVGIDEYLYYSLARSIATEGKLLFRGQSADYAFAFYPLVLSPVYLFFRDGANYYRLLQFWNIILMSASIFPLFGLGKAILKSEKKALIAASVSLLLPDFILGELIFSEAVLYPLFFSVMYCAYIYIIRNDKKYLLFVGILGGLLYSTKPGAVTPAAVFLLLTLLHGMVKKERKHIVYALEAVLALCATAAAFWLLVKYVFGYEGGFLSVYESQVDGTASRNLKAFLKSLVIYPYYFILACGVIGFAYPAAMQKKWERENRAFWYFTIISLAVMILGSAWAVEQVTKLNNIHLRYVASYIPLMLLFCCVPEQETAGRIKESKKMSYWKLGAVPCFEILCTLIFGCKAKAHTTGAHALMSLSLLNDNILPTSRQMLGNIIILLLCAAVFFLLIRRYGKKHLDTICLLIVGGCMAMNGILGYAIVHNEYHPQLAQDGREMCRLTEGKQYIYLMSNEGVADIGVDVNTKRNSCVVYTNDFVNCLQRNNGVYIPYVPEKMRGMTSVKETPEVDLLVVDYDSFPFLQLSEYTTALSPFDRNTVFAVQFTPGKRLVDSTLSNLTNRSLSPGKPGILLLFNEEYLQRPMTVRLEIESGTEQTMTINSTHEIYSVKLSTGKAWYDIEFKKAEEAFNFNVEDAPIKVSAYELLSETNKTAS